MKYIKEPVITHGFSPVVERGEGGIRSISLGLITLNPQEEYGIYTDSNEYLIVVLGGTCAIETGGGKSKLGKRANVFEGKAESVYLPPGTHCTITAVTPFEAACINAPSNSKSEVRILREDTVKGRKVGSDNWARLVYSIFDDRYQAGSLVVGETFNPPGNWSKRSSAQARNGSASRRIRTRGDIFLQAASCTGVWCSAHLYR